MARPADLTASVQSARLLRIQRAREARARVEAATAAAAREAAAQALEAAAARRCDAERAAEQAARGRWDATHGTLLSAASLAALRQAEAADRDLIHQADRDATVAERAAAAASRAAEAAAAAVVAHTLMGLRRERLATGCAARLRRRLLREEEAMLEHDDAGRA